MKSVRTTLAFAAAWSILAFGVLSLLNPLVAVRLVGLEIVEPRGWSDFRATYGAMWIVMGAALLWAIPTRPRSMGWVRLTAAMWTAAALARVASVVLDGVWTPVNVAVTAAYAAVAVILVLASLQRVPERTTARVRPPAVKPLRAGDAGARPGLGSRWRRNRSSSGGSTETAVDGASSDVRRPSAAPGTARHDDEGTMDDDRAVPPPPLWSSGDVDPTGEDAGQPTGDEAKSS